MNREFTRYQVLPSIELRVPLTLTLSPEEREQSGTPPASLIARPAFPAAWFSEVKHSDNTARSNCPGAANGSPSVGGEGRGEGERFTLLSRTRHNSLSPEQGGRV